ncbi:MAG TPA: hypothetical protein PK069_00730 [Methanolinea sp.]|nr:hypothetical protein [Methanolinea sp.]HQK54947.1 hypothetical protein [Methanolinea sp.]
MNQENGLPYWVIVGDMMADSGIIKSVIDQACLDIGSEGAMNPHRREIRISGSSDNNLPDWTQFAEVIATVLSLPDLCDAESACT